MGILRFRSGVQNCMAIWQLADKTGNAAILYLRNDGGVSYISHDHGQSRGSSICRVLVQRAAP